MFNKIKDKWIDFLNRIAEQNRKVVEAVELIVVNLKMLIDLRVSSSLILVEGLESWLLV